VTANWLKGRLDVIGSVGRRGGTPALNDSVPAIIGAAGSMIETSGDMLEAAAIMTVYHMIYRIS
jgi:hypothetical protein